MGRWWGASTPRAEEWKASLPVPNTPQSPTTETSYNQDASYHATVAIHPGAATSESIQAGLTLLGLIVLNGLAARRSRWSRNLGSVGPGLKYQPKGKDGLPFTSERLCSSTNTVGNGGPVMPWRKCNATAALVALVGIGPVRPSTRNQSWSPFFPSA